MSTAEDASIDGAGTGETVPDASVESAGDVGSASAVADGHTSQGAGGVVDASGAGAGVAAGPDAPAVGIWDWEREGDTDDHSAGAMRPAEDESKGLPGWSLAVIIIAILGIVALIVAGFVRGNSVQSAPTTTFPSCNSALTTASRLAYNPKLATPYLLGGIVEPATGSPSATAAVTRISTNTHGLAAVCPYVTVGDMVGVMSTAWQHGKRVGATFPQSVRSVLQGSAPGTRFVVKSISISSKGKFTATGTSVIKTQKRSGNGTWKTVGTTGAAYRLVELGGAWYVDATEGQSAVILLPAS